MLFNNSDDYYYWRDEKLANSPVQLSDCTVEIQNPLVLSSAEKDKIRQLCRNHNFALFQIPPCDNYLSTIANINQQFGLVDFDPHLFAQDQGLTHICQSNNSTQGEFIPYTNKNLGWHTDGYYNPIAQRIRAFSLFCVRPALSGGINQWIDPQMVYLLLREDNVDVAKALTHPQAMSIPEHKIATQVRRAVSVGAIFFMDEPSGSLSMRYTQRKKHIEFLDSVEVKQAIGQLDDLLNTPAEHHFKHLMQTGQGLLCNNVLHKRDSFTDDENNPRLLLRGRYFNSIS